MIIVPARTGAVIALITFNHILTNKAISFIPEGIWAFLFGKILASDEQ
jgi:hypothetical protein